MELPYSLPLIEVFKPILLKENSFVVLMICDLMRRPFWFPAKFD
jgi:hypothetical protein